MPGSGWLGCRHPVAAFPVPVPRPALHDLGGNVPLAFEVLRRDLHALVGNNGKSCGVFEGMGDGLAEWIITAPGGRQIMLQMFYFDRGHQPVLMDIGPGLDLDDVVGGKVCALASRAVERDYVDTAAALGRGYPVERLIGLARALDPGLTAEDFADAGRRLDRLDDEAFARYNLGPADVDRLRQRFAAWPRS